MKREIKWHKSCKCICRLDPIICNKKQRWNKDKCRCECKELTDKGVCDKGYFFNPSNCDCECDKSFVTLPNKLIKFVKEQEAKGLLSNLGIKTPLSKFLY